MTTSMKIFRPWTSVADKKTEEQKINEIDLKVRNSAFTRVPESGYPAHKFPDYYDSTNTWNAISGTFEDWNTIQSLPLQLVENFAQNLSYLDSTYLSIAFPDIYGNPKMNKMKQRPKKFRCPHCKVSFSNNGQLKGHVRIHTGERPYKCDSEKCGKSFTRNEELTRHKRIHTGLRPFPCDQCGKRFGRKDHLKKHIRTHFPQPRYLEANFVPLYPVLFGY